MKIGIDVRAGIKSNRAGKGEYVYQLVTYLIKHTEHQFVLFGDGDLPNEWKSPNVQAKIWRGPSWWWQILAVGQLSFKHPVDVYLSTTSVIVPALTWRTPVVTTLFDFVSFIFPARHQLKAVLLEKIWMRPALNRSRSLLAISESTKRDATNLFGVNPSKITVSYLGPAVVASEMAMTLPASPIVLFVGTLEPRKNLVNLISAFNQIRQQGVGASLLMAGGWGWQSDEIKSAIASSPYAADIKVLGYVTEAQKTYLYKHATVLAFPSIYEGFGMPPLEAMGLGLPVITTNVSSLPEVVGEAALLVAPDSVVQLAGAIVKVLTDGELRERLKQTGLIRSQQFDWQKTADVTLGVLTSIRV